MASCCRKAPVARVLPPVPDAESELHKRLASLAARRDAVTALGAALAGDGDITAQEAPNKPEILGHFARRVNELARLAGALGRDAAEVQGLLDAALLALTAGSLVIAFVIGLLIR